MFKSIIATGILVLIYGNSAQANPNNITFNCRFRDAKTDLRCHAVANLHYQGEAADHLLVNCPGLGNDTIVYNDDAELSVVSGAGSINPKGEAALPAVMIPMSSVVCHQNPIRVDALLKLPEREPYNSAELEGSCRVVTAGCND